MRLGITTTVPVEAIFAAGHTPVDLNNLLIGSPDPAAHVARAERDGLPRNMCSWVKGIYGVARSGAVDGVVSVTRGDCDATSAMTNLLRHRGMSIVPFAYPEAPDPEAFGSALGDFCGALGTDTSSANACYGMLSSARAAALELESTIAKLDAPMGTIIDSAAVHERLVSCSDFYGEPLTHVVATRALLERATRSFELAVPSALRSVGPDATLRNGLRIALTGVPPIFTDIFVLIEELGARVVVDEVPRQFALPRRYHPTAVRAPGPALASDAQGASARDADPAPASDRDILSAYSEYTYPYGPAVRAADLVPLCDGRGVHGVIHYVQTFCHRQIDAPVLSDALPYPSMILEGDALGPVDARTRMRLEAFLSSLRERVVA